MINIPGPVKSFRKIRNYGLNSTRHNMLVVLSATAIKKSNEKTRKHIKKQIKTRFPKRFLKRKFQRSRGSGYKLVLPQFLKAGTKEEIFQQYGKQICKQNENNSYYVQMGQSIQRMDQVRFVEDSL